MAAWAIAVSPDRHSLFTVTAGTVIGMPPLAAASRAGFGPTPAWTTLPKMTASTCSPARPTRDRAARIAMPAELGGGQRGQRAEQLPDRGARPGDDDRLGHG